MEDNALALVRAVLAFQKEAPDIAKSATADTGKFKYNYAKLEDIQKEINPILHKHGLFISQAPSHINDQPALRTTLFHKDGAQLEDVTPLVIANHDPQSLGSAITYQRRYGLAAVLGLVLDEDDDAQSAMPQSTTRTSGAIPPASTAQKNFMIKLFAEHAPDDDFVQWYKNEYNKEATNMNIQEAKEVIERLKAGQL